MKLTVAQYNIKTYPVHEHNYTRILVPEVLCSLGGQETQNDTTMTATVAASIVTVALLGTFTCTLFSTNSFFLKKNINELEQK